MTRPTVRVASVGRKVFDCRGRISKALPNIMGTRTIGVAPFGPSFSDGLITSSGQLPVSLIYMCTSRIFQVLIFRTTLALTKHCTGRGDKVDESDVSGELWISRVVW